MLLELFAYLADWLAQHADAIAGEAYLAARRRGSKLQAQSRLQVEVDGEGWQRVSSLEASGLTTRTTSWNDATTVRRSSGSAMASGAVAHRPMEMSAWPIGVDHDSCRSRCSPVAS